MERVCLQFYYENNNYITNCITSHEYQLKYFTCNMRIICLAVKFCVIFEAWEENAQDLNSI
jgi:hypothetical protein